MSKRDIISVGRKKGGRRREDEGGRDESKREGE